MKTREVFKIDYCFDLDYGEGWLTFYWRNASDIKRSLSIDCDGFCHREMPIRSGAGVTFSSAMKDRVLLRFTPELAEKLRLNEVVEFNGEMSDETYNALLQFAESL